MASPNTARQVRRPSPSLRRVVACVLLSLLLLPATLSAQTDPLLKIRQLYTSGLEAYDFFEFDAAEQAFDEAVELAEQNAIRDPIVAKVYLARGILFYARFKDTAAKVAEEKTFDEFVAAVSNDYDVEIPADYKTVELQAILDRAREIVPPSGRKPVSSGNVALQHEAIAVTDACKPIPIRAKVPAHPDAFRAFLYYLPTAGTSYTQVELQPDQSDPEIFVAEIPIEATQSPTISYYIEVVNRQQNAVASAGSRSKPLSITVIGSCDSLPGSKQPIVQIGVTIGTGIGLASGDSENCKKTPDCFGADNDPSRFEGVRAGLAPLPLHSNLEVNFNVMKDLQLGLFFRGQIIELAWMVGAKLRYMVLSEEPHRFYTGLGVGFGEAAMVVDLGPEFNNFRDIVRAYGPAHVGFSIGYLLSLHDNVGLQFDLYTPIHFPDFTFHFDLSVGPYFQF